MSTPRAPVRDADLAAYWNGPGGRRWTERGDAPETIFAPIAELLYARAQSAPGERVIDIGCGGGATTLAIASQVGAAGGVIGVDVLTLMIARASERAGATSAATFLRADAGSHDFAPGWANLLFSRFGVMFFADPVASFANLRKGLAHGGRVVFACWREAKRNPWQMIALKAACKHVPRLPEVGPEDPGPFSFADEERVRRILAAAGFETIALTPVDLELDVAAGRGSRRRSALCSRSAPPAARSKANPRRCAPPPSPRSAPHWRHISAGGACRSAPQSGSSRPPIPKAGAQAGLAISSTTSARRSAALATPTDWAAEAAFVSAAGWARAPRNNSASRCGVNSVCGTTVAAPAAARIATLAA